MVGKGLNSCLKRIMTLSRYGMMLKTSQIHVDQFYIQLEKETVLVLLNVSQAIASCIPVPFPLPHRLQSSAGLFYLRSRKVLPCSLKLGQSS